MQQVGLIGVGRMGKVLASRLAGHVELRIFDRNRDKMVQAADELGLSTAQGMEELAAMGTVILVVPDQEVVSCIKEFNQIKKELVVINVATNVAQHTLEESAAKHIQCISAKIVGHAGEMALGQNPVIIVNHRPAALVPMVEAIFSAVGQVVIGKSDMVTEINTVAASAVLEAAVRIEEILGRKGITDAAVIKSAIGQVATGTIKAYASGDLGPFAREIVRAIQAKIKR